MPGRAASGRPAAAVRSSASAPSSRRTARTHASRTPCGVHAGAVRRCGRASPLFGGELLARVPVSLLREKQVAGGVPHLEHPAEHRSFQFMQRKPLRGGLVDVLFQRRRLPACPDIPACPPAPPAPRQRLPQTAPQTDCPNLSCRERLRLRTNLLTISGLWRCDTSLDQPKSRLSKSLRRVGPGVNWRVGLRRSGRDHRMPERNCRRLFELKSNALVSHAHQRADGIRMCVAGHSARSILTV